MNNCFDCIHFGASTPIPRFHRRKYYPRSGKKSWECNQSGLIISEDGYPYEGMILNGFMLPCQHFIPNFRGLMIKAINNGNL